MSQTLESAVHPQLFGEFEPLDEVIAERARDSLSIPWDTPDVIPDRRKAITVAYRPVNNHGRDFVRVWVPDQAFNVTRYWAFGEMAADPSHFPFHGWQNFQTYGNVGAYSWFFDKGQQLIASPPEIRGAVWNVEYYNQAKPWNRAARYLIEYDLGPTTPVNGPFLAGAYRHLKRGGTDVQVLLPNLADVIRSRFFFRL